MGQFFFCPPGSGFNPAPDTKTAFTNEQVPVTKQMKLEALTKTTRKCSILFSP